MLSSLPTTRSSRGMLMLSPSFDIPFLKTLIFHRFYTSLFMPAGCNLRPFRLISSLKWQWIRCLIVRGFSIYSLTEKRLSIILTSSMDDRCVASHFSFDGLMSRRWASRQSLEKFCDRNSLGNKDSLVVVVNTIDVRSSALKFLANCVTNELTFISFHKDSLVDCISISCWLQWCYLSISSSFLYKSFLNRWRFLRSCIIR